MLCPPPAITERLLALRANEQNKRTPRFLPQSLPLSWRRADNRVYRHANDITRKAARRGACIQWIRKQPFGRKGCFLITTTPEAAGRKAFRRDHNSSNRGTGRRLALAHMTYPGPRVSSSCLHCTITGCASVRLARFSPVEGARKGDTVEDKADAV